MKKKIPTWVGALFIAGIASLVGSCLWINMQNNNDDYTPSVTAPANENQSSDDGVFCNSKKGAKMSLGEARKIAAKSECGNKFKGKNVCNDNTGTWWLDLDLKKEGCNPACVVNMETKEALINWRCTGLLPKN